MLYIDNSVTGIEHIVAQCLDNKIIDLYNYYSTCKWEITAQICHRTIHLANGNGVLDEAGFVAWLEAHGHKIL